jgi:hypothetical protein
MEKGRTSGLAVTGLSIVTVIIFVTMSGCAALQSGEKEPVDQTSKTATEEPATEAPATEEAPAIIIGDCEYGKDYEGKPTIIVNYEWTNTTDETTSLVLSYSIKAYQNGVELKTSLFADDWQSDKEDDSSDWLADVKPGATIKTSEAYLISDKSAPVEIEVSGLFDDEILTKKTFDAK